MRIIIGSMQTLPILYSFRRCPYAIRARMTLMYAGVQVELREVLLKDKPKAMLDVSDKGTVPVLVLPTDEVIDESVDVMRWALAQKDPRNWALPDRQENCDAWVSANDNDFKHWLDHYKYADRFPDHSQDYYRARAEQFLQKLETALRHSPWISGAELGFADIAVFPFIRQFSGVDSNWFARAPYPSTRQWLETLLSCEWFMGCMQKHRPWAPGDAPIMFPESEP